MDKNYKNEYDNPYRMLAASIATRYGVSDAQRILLDRDYIRQAIQSEVRNNIDVPGDFCDCITTELISNKQKVLYRSALNELGLFFFNQLDIPRLRKELIRFYQDCGIDIQPNKK